MADFKGKNVMITGATRGIGYALAEEFAKAGANLAVCGTSETALKEAAEKLSAFGGKVYVWDGMQSDEYSPIMYINTSPEPLIASLEGIKKWNLSNRE